MSCLVIAMGVIKSGDVCFEKLHVDADREDPLLDDHNLIRTTHDNLRLQTEEAKMHIERDDEWDEKL